MNHGMLRTAQVGVALLVLGLLALVVLVVIGVLERGAALTIGVDITLVIGACVLAGVVLLAVLGGGRREPP
jgi:hypothetical protein